MRILRTIYCYKTGIFAALYVSLSLNRRVLISVLRLFMKWSRLRKRQVRRTYKLIIRTVFIVKLVISSALPKISSGRRQKVAADLNTAKYRAFQLKGSPSSDGIRSSSAIGTRALEPKERTYPCLSFLRPQLVDL